MILPDVAATVVDAGHVGLAEVVQAADRRHRLVGGVAEERGGRDPQRVVDRVGAGDRLGDLAGQRQPCRSLVGLDPRCQPAQRDRDLLADGGDQRGIRRIEAVRRPLRHRDRRHALAVDHDRGHDQGVMLGLRRPVVVRVLRGAPEHDLLAQGDRVADQAPGERPPHTGHRCAVAGEVRHDDLLVGLGKHAGGLHRGVPSLLVHQPGDQLERLVERGGRWNRGGQARRQQQPVGLPLGLLPQLDCLERRAHLLADGRHQHGVSRAEPVALVIPHLDRAGGLAVDHHRGDDHRVVLRGVRPAVVRVGGHLAAGLLPARQHRPSRDAGVQRAPQPGVAAAGADEVCDADLLARLAVGHDGGDAGVAGLRVDQLRNRGEQLLGAAGGCHQLGHLAGECQALGPAVCPGAEADAGQRRRQLIGDGAQNRGLETVVVASMLALHRQHGDALAVRRHRRDQHPPAVGQVAVGRLARHRHLPVLGDRLADRAKVERSPPDRRARRRAVERGDDLVLACRPVDHRRGHRPVVTVLEDGAGRHRHRALDAAGGRHCARDLRGNGQALRPLLELSPQADAAQGPCSFFGDGRHQHGVVLIEHARPGIAQLQHRLAAAVDHDRGREDGQQRRRPGVVGVGGGVGQKHLGALPDHPSDHAFVQRPADAGVGAAVGADVGDVDLQLALVIDQHGADPREVGVRRDGACNHLERLAGGGGRADGSGHLVCDGQPPALKPAVQLQREQGGGDRGIAVEQRLGVGAEGRAVLADDRQGGDRAAGRDDGASQLAGGRLAVRGGAPQQRDTIRAHRSANLLQQGVEAIDVPGDLGARVHRSR